MVHIVSHFFLFFFLIYFNGKIFLENFKLNNLNLDIFQISIFGLIFTGLFAQIINIFIPLNFFLLILNLIIINTYLIYNYKKFFFRIKKIDYIYFILFLLITLNIYGSDFSDDLNNYHYGFILNSDSGNFIVGMSHLYQMYAFSPIWLTTHSYFNFDYSRLQDIHVLNGLIFFIFLSIFYKEIKDSFDKKRINILIPVTFFILVFVLIKYTRLKEFGIDRPSFLIIFFFIFFILKNFFSNLKENQVDSKIILMIYLSMFLFYSKIIFFFTALIPIYYIIRYKKLKIFFSKNFLPIYLIILGYFIKNLIISGCLIFPISLTCLNFLSWSAKEYAEYQMIFTEIINKSWTIYNGQLTNIEYIRDFNWIETWFNRHKIEFFEFFLTSGLATILTLFSFKSLKEKKSNFYFLKNSELITIFSLLFVIQLIFFISKNPVIRMSHYLFVFFYSMIIIFIFRNFKLHLKKRVISAIFIFAISFNAFKNFTRISENNFINDPHQMVKPYIDKQTKEKLGDFEYYNGWYGNFPAGKVILGSSFDHKKKFIFDIIYKVN